ncbi:hypothetical protein SLA2020_294490 [Shorea laevis]
MSAAPNYLVFFLVVFFFLSASTALEEHKQKNDTAAPTVHIINGMARNSEAIQVRCSSRGGDLGYHTMGSGDNYVWSVELQRALYYCEAMWGVRYFASWHAFQPKRDTGRGTVFWLVKENGLFLSWDNSTWVRRSQWQTE